MAHRTQQLGRSSGSSARASRLRSLRTEHVSQVCSFANLSFRPCRSLRATSGLLMTPPPMSPHLTPIKGPEGHYTRDLSAVEDEGVSLLDGNQPNSTETAEEPGASNGLDNSARNRSRLLKGFYAYSIASEVYVIVAGSLFLPVILETYARENGRLGPSYLLPCPPSSKVPSDGGSADATRCAVRFFGHYLDTASFSLYTYSASVAVQALTVISMGNWADEPKARHRLLITFASIGTACTIGFLFLPASSPVWPACVLLALGANVSFGAGSVCLNSYLPDLGRTSPNVLGLHTALIAARSRLKALRHPPPTPGSSRSSSRNNVNISGDEVLSASQSVVRASDEYVHAKALATSAISSRGIALGYLSGIMALVVAFIPIIIGGESSWGMRMAIAGAGTAWGAGTIPASIWLRPSLNYSNPKDELASVTLRTRIAAGWKELGRMLRDWRRLPATFVFLGACFLLSDAGSTITSTAMLFAKTTLGIPTYGLIAISIISPAAGICGAISVPRLQKRWHWSNLRVLIILATTMTLIPIWAIVALRRAWEIYPLAFIFGALYGSLQAFIRTCFSELIPTSRSAQFFGLLSITDKSSSFLGPLLVAVITNATGQIRHGFYLILVMLLLTIPVLAQVDMDSGRDDAENYERAEFQESLMRAGGHEAGYVDAY